MGRLEAILGVEEKEYGRRRKEKDMRIRRRAGTGKRKERERVEEKTEELRKPCLEELVVKGGVR